MMGKKNNNTKISIKEKPTDIILGRQYDVGEEHPNYKIAKGVKTVASETITVINPITKRKAKVELSRTGTSEEKLGALMLSPDATREQKDSMIAQYLFEQGRENGSFMAELFISKGTLTKQTQAFKSQMRWDFENFASMMVLMMQDIANDVKQSIDVGREANNILYTIAARFESCAELIISEREKITTARMQEKGYGVYIDNQGKAYSIFEDEIEQVVRKDKESIKEN